MKRPPRVCLPVLLLLSWPASLPAGDLQRMSPAAFARRPELQAPIDPGDIDRELLAAAVFHETNRVRAEAGLPPLRSNRRLDDAADMQASMGSLLMQTGHGNPRPDEDTVFDRVIKAGLRPMIVSENVALTPLAGPAENGAAPGRSGREPATLSYAGYARTVVAQWMDSPPHRSTILNPKLRELGCSVRPKKTVNGWDALFAVQVFQTPVASP